MQLQMPESFLFCPMMRSIKAFYKSFLHNSARFGHTESVPFAGTCGGNFFQNWSDHYGDQKEKQQHSLFRDPVQAQHGHRKLLRSGLHLCGHPREQPHRSGVHQLRLLRKAQHTGLSARSGSTGRERDLVSLFLRYAEKFS